MDAETKKQKQDELARKIEEMREQRKNKEKARLEKLREMNLQKYKCEDTKSVFQTPRVSSTQSRPKNFNSMTDLRRKSLIPRPVETQPDSAAGKVYENNLKIRKNEALKTVSKPEMRDVTASKSESIIKDKLNTDKTNIASINAKNILKLATTVKVPVTTSVKVNLTEVNQEKVLPKIKIDKPRQSIAPMKIRQSIAPRTMAGPFKPMNTVASEKKLPEKVGVTSKPPLSSRMSIKPTAPKKDVTKNVESKPIFNIPKRPATDKKDKLSVFERLYTSKSQTAVRVRKETIIEHKNRLVASHASRRSMAPVEFAKDKVNKMRRSISAVHFKRIGKEELKSCFHRHASFGEGLNKIDMKRINEDDHSDPQIVNSIRSERKKVKFHTTPRLEDLEVKLKSWLQKRGKSVDSFQHLRCFGVHRSALNENGFDEENKENIEVSISDDGSFSELVNETESKTQWRRASLFNDSEVTSPCTEADKSLVSAETPVPAPRDDVLLSALNDLSILVREGYDWEQCARWLRAVRERSPAVTELAAYWECRAALEECRGNLPKSCLCWEEAIAKGTEASVAEASIDQLLDKFMQLNISPGKAGVTQNVNPRDIMCAKNVFKSSLIRFAVQNAKAKSESTKYTVTPVRRSSRLSTYRNPTPANARTPLLQLASSLRHIDEDIREKAVFIPNKLLQYSP